MLTSFGMLNHPALLFVQLSRIKNSVPSRTESSRGSTFFTSAGDNCTSTLDRHLTVPPCCLCSQPLQGSSPRDLPRRLQLSAAFLWRKGYTWVLFPSSLSIYYNRGKYTMTTEESHHSRPQVFLNSGAFYYKTDSGGKLEL